METDVALPAFALDCRDWVVATHADGPLDEDLSPLPVVAVLSTVVVADGVFNAATAVISLALLSDADAAELGPMGTGFNLDLRLSDEEWMSGHGRYVAPSPSGGLALVAEFSTEPEPPLELTARFHELLDSFAWTDAGDVPPADAAGTAAPGGRSAEVAATPVGAGVEVRNSPARGLRGVWQSLRRK